MLPWKEGTVYFSIIWHAHQPLGNFPWVIEEAYQKAYFPLLQMIAKYPEIKSNLHFSGPLLMWLHDNHPEYLDQVVNLYHRNQIEIVGGGFYDPILAIIPDKDKEKQIQLMIDWWEKNYSVTPQGIWLAERVWVPSLIPILNKMEIEYIFIDDYLFKMVGLSEEQTFYSYMTENEGKSIIVLPINESVRYLVPWKKPEETVEYLTKGRDFQHEKIIVMMSDMEKMGLWPAGDRTTYKICYVDGYNGKPWMESFFEAILANSWIKLTLISEYLGRKHPRRLVYLPAGSYDKMSLWALTTPLRKRLENLHQMVDQNKVETELAEDIKTFTTGSIWQNFLVKYSQANIMHKRMLICRNKIEKTEKELSYLSSERFQRIWENILASQSNDAYWHGSSAFGGIYYLFLRHSIHKHILTAEHLLDKLRNQEGLKEISSKIQDVLLDGQPDGILENEYVSCYISSLIGGSIFSLNLKERGYNFLNVLTRQNEAYHTDDIPIVQDRFEKWTFQDHFLFTSVKEEALQKDTYQDLGDFANKQYDILQNTDGSITLKRKSVIRLKENTIQAMVSKTYYLNHTKLLIKYDINLSSTIDPDTLLFSPEINVIGVSYPYKTTGTINGKQFDLAKLVNPPKCKTLEIQDLNELERVSIVINFKKAIKCVIFPLFSFLKDQVGFEETYQGTSIFPKITISGKKFSFIVEIIFKSFNRKEDY